MEDLKKDLEQMPLPSDLADCLDESEDKEDDLGKDGVLYKKMYYKMANCVTDVIETLKKMQIECEEIYISGGDED